MIILFVLDLVQLSAANETVFTASVLSVISW